MSQTSTGYFGRMLKAKNKLKRIGIRGAELTEEILSLVGVSEIYITPDLIKVWIKRNHEWTDTEPEIIKLLNNF